MVIGKKKKDQIIIQSYQGYSSPQRIYLTGRILEDEQISSDANESFLTTIRNNFKRWESDEITKVPNIATISCFSTNKESESNNW